MVESKALLAEVTRLPGLDGKAKMSKSLNNAIFLADDSDNLKKKVMSMYTDSKHIRITDPGQIEGNTVFTYLDAFDTDKAKVAELKEHYSHGGLGDVTVKKYLLEVLEVILSPIRSKRIELAKNPDEVYRILRDGSMIAKQTASATLDEVRRAIGVNYF